MTTHRSSSVVVFLLVLMPMGLHADDFRVADVFLGYSLLHGDLQNHASGWEISGGGYFKQWLSLHADFDAHHQSAAGSVRHQHDFLFGPQFSYRTSNLTLFTHALAGACHTSGSFDSKTGFASVAGGGINWDFSPVLAFRFVQADYHTARLFGAIQHQARFSFGIIFHLIGWADPPRPIPPPPDQKPPETAHTH